MSAVAALPEAWIDKAFRILDMPNERLATLEEKVTNHIRFFWTVVAFGLVWLAAISGFLFHINGNVNSVQIAQADAPSRIVSALLRHPVESKTDQPKT